MLRANLLSVELDATLDVAGFRHRGTSVTDALGTVRLGAGVYEADQGAPIWPYHHHHGVEEWLLVLSGSPELREPAGRRTLTPGEMVAFPSGPAGAHGVAGPSRFVIFSTGQHREPWESVYPDAHKQRTAEGMLALLRCSMSSRPAFAAAVRCSAPPWADSSSARRCLRWG